MFQQRTRSLTGEMERRMKEIQRMSDIFVWKDEATYEPVKQPYG